MPRYAESTSVSSEQSRAEIERILVRYGADQFAYGWEAGRAMLAFRASGKHVRFLLPMPDREAAEFRLTPSRKWARSEAEQGKAYEQAVRQCWRALKLVVQAKLEAVEAGITTFEDEFLAQLVLPDNRTVGEWLMPQVERAYELGVMPSLLALAGGADAP